MSMRRFNTKAMKLSTAGVREMYARLKAGELTQGEAARIYGLGVIQVGRIARGESRAQETGAQGDEIPNAQGIQPTAGELAESMRLLDTKLGQSSPSLTDKPPTEDEDNAVTERGITGLNEELRPTARQQQISDELDKFDKGD